MLEDLIERVKKLDGPDRELDLDILLFVEPGKWRPSLAWAGHKDIVTEDVNTDDFDIGDYPSTKIVPRYTASIDAALTLVPEGFAWKVGTCGVSDDAWVVPDYNSQVHGDRLRKELGEPVSGSIWDHGIDVDQRPPGRVAIALCIAALKARRDATGIDLEFYCGSTEHKRSANWHWSNGKFRPCTGLTPVTTFVQPTHWMPLPSPPADSEGKL